MLWAESQSCYVHVKTPNRTGRPFQHDLDSSTLRSYWWIRKHRWTQGPSQSHLTPHSPLLLPCGPWEIWWHLLSSPTHINLSVWCGGQRHQPLSPWLSEGNLHCLFGLWSMIPIRHREMTALRETNTSTETFLEFLERSYWCHEAITGS